MEPSSSSNKKRRAQAFSGEFLIAYFIFSLAFITAIYLWENINSDMVASGHIYEIEEIPVDTAEKLVNTRGLPDNWSSGGEIFSIGLVNDSRILDQGKILKFIEIMNSSNSNYEDNKYLIGIGKYDFYFNITDINGSGKVIGNQSLSAGKSPSNETNKITVVRTAILGDEIVRIRLTLWN